MEEEQKPLIVFGKAENPDVAPIRTPPDIPDTDMLKGRRIRTIAPGSTTLLKKRSVLKEKLPLFFTAVVQVTFVAMNVLFISHKMVVPMLITGFMISLVWTLNVKRVAFGGWWDRITYATGAMVGTGLGYLISASIIKVL